MKWSSPKWMKKTKCWKIQNPLERIRKSNEVKEIESNWILKSKLFFQLDEPMECKVVETRKSIDRNATTKQRCRVGFVCKWFKPAKKNWRIFRTSRENQLGCVSGHYKKKENCVFFCSFVTRAKRAIDHRHLLDRLVANRSPIDPIGRERLDEGFFTGSSFTFVMKIIKRSHSGYRVWILRRFVAFRRPRPDLKGVASKIVVAVVAVVAVVVVVVVCLGSLSMSRIVVSSFSFLFSFVFFSFFLFFFSVTDKRPVGGDGSRFESRFLFSSFPIIHPPPPPPTVRTPRSADAQRSKCWLTCNREKEKETNT